MTEYSFYGFRLRSPVPLSLLQPCVSQRAADVPTADGFGVVTSGPGTPKDVVTLREGEVPEELEDVIWHTPFLSVARSGLVLVRIAAAGRFLIRDGSEVVMQPAPGVAAGELETFLVGVVAGVILHQRALLPLHASCVSIGGKVVALSGPSGSGKSTLAAALTRAGATLLSDDIGAVVFRGTEPPLVAQGALGLRLWPDSKCAVGMGAGKWMPIRRDHPKLVSPVSPVIPMQAPERSAGTLIAVIRLRAGNYPEPGIRRRYGPSAVAPLAEMVYRARLGRVLGRGQDLFLGLMRLVDTVPVFELRRPPAVDLIQESVDRVLSVTGGSL